MSKIIPIVMPKWGLSMREGTINDWLVTPGTQIEVGMPILDVETDKLANEVEAPDAGLLRRQCAQAGEILPVKALLGVMADASVSDEEIDAFIAAYEVPSDQEDEADGTESVFSHVEVDGVRIRYRQTGQGKPLLLIHGFGGDLNNFLFNIDALAAAHQVTALDLPAHGGSAITLPEPPDYPALARFVLHFMDAIGLQQVDILAHSMGGAIAAQLALDAPGRVGKLALVSPAGLGEEVNRQYIDGFIQAESRREMKPVLGLLLAQADDVNRQMVDDVLQYKRLDGVTQALEQLGSTLFPEGKQPHRPTHALDTGTHPLLLLWGEEDQIIPVGHADLAPAGSTVKRVSGSGHMCHMDHATQVNEWLLAFFGQ